MNDLKQFLSGNQKKLPGRHFSYMRNIIGLITSANSSARIPVQVREVLNIIFYSKNLVIRSEY